MLESEISLSVYFDGQFWVGLFEKISHKKKYELRQAKKKEKKLGH